MTDTGPESRLRFDVLVGSDASYVVDAVTSGDMAPVTSNAVHESISAKDEFHTVEWFTASESSRNFQISYGTTFAVIQNTGGFTGVTATLPLMDQHGKVLLVKNLCDGDNTGQFMTLLAGTEQTIDNKFSGIRLDHSSSNPGDHDTHANQTARLVCVVNDGVNYILRLNDSY